MSRVRNTGKETKPKAPKKPSKKASAKLAPVVPVAAINTAPKTRGKPFQPGNKANPKGRPPGSRNKISEAFITAMCHDFDAHGEAVIASVRDTKPEVYLRVVADLVPKEFGMNLNASDAFLNLFKIVSTGAIPNGATP